MTVSNMFSMTVEEQSIVGLSTATYITEETSIALAEVLEDLCMGRRFARS
jgi:hypothetical protein